MDKTLLTAGQRIILGSGNGWNKKTIIQDKLRLLHLMVIRVIISEDMLFFLDKVKSSAILLFSDS